MMKMEVPVCQMFQDLLAQVRSEANPLPGPQPHQELLRWGRRQ
jgi:hypothetical protein